LYFGAASPRLGRSNNSLIASIVLLAFAGDTAVRIGLYTILSL